VCAAAAFAADAGAVLRGAEREYREHLLRARPDLATRFRVRGADARLVPVTEATLAADSLWLERLAARLAAIDRAALGPATAARLDTLRARVEAERAPYASGAWRRDPAAYLALGPGAVLAAAAAPGAGACTRAKHAAARLRALPEVLRSARVTLAAAPLADTSAAPWLAAMDSLRALPARLAACRDPAREADLVEADTLALEACARFVRFLREEHPSAAGTRRD